MPTPDQAATASDWLTTSSSKPLAWQKQKPIFLQGLGRCAKNLGLPIELIG
jgi:hypothetical protein